MDIFHQFCRDVYLLDYDVRRVARNLRKISYSVQYNESRYDFLQRLLREAGISYTFRHSEKSHQMILFLSILI